MEALAEPYLKILLLLFVQDVESGSKAPQREEHEEQIVLHIRHHVLEGVDERSLAGGPEYPGPLTL